MTLDAYGFCHCGSGKKVKFCCCKDILHDLEKVQRAAEGEQFVAAADLAHRAINQHGPRPALLALLAETQLTQGNVEAAQEAAVKLKAALPHSPVALSLQAIGDVHSGEPEAAIEHLQDALEQVDQYFPPTVYLTLAIVGNFLIESGEFLAGRGHLMLQARFSRGRDATVLDQLHQVGLDHRVPIVLKEEFSVPPCPDGVPWQGEFLAAIHAARRGTWRVACESLESLNQKVPHQPCVWRSIAILRSWLAHNERAVAAWRTYASLPDVSLEEAVEAEALAVCLTGTDDTDLIDFVKLKYPITDFDRFLEFLLSDRRQREEQGDLTELVDEGEPPPRALFQVLDRPALTSPEGVTSTLELPIVIGRAIVYGRQTDQEARVELCLMRNADFARRRDEIAARWEKFIGPLAQEEVINRVSRLRAEVNVERVPPEDLTRAQAMALRQDQLRHTYLSSWPDARLSSLDGKTVREAAKDSSLRNRVLGVILNLELMAEESGHEIDLNELRRALNLPERSRITADKDTTLLQISLPQLGRLDYSQLSDEQLKLVVTRLSVGGYMSAYFRCGREVLKRPAGAIPIDRETLLRDLTRLASKPDDALELIEQGRATAVANKKSPAEWYLQELQVRLALGQPEPAQRLLNLLVTRHIKEPGVAEAVQSLLQSLGLIGPDGTPTRPDRDEGSAATAAAAPSGGIWTPDSAAAAPKGESKLWLPGRD